MFNCLTFFQSSCSLHHHSKEHEGTLVQILPSRFLKYTEVLTIKEERKHTRNMAV